MGAHGYYHHEEKHIALGEGMGELADRTFEKICAMTDEEFAELDVYTADKE